MNAQVQRPQSLNTGAEPTIAGYSPLAQDTGVGSGAFVSRGHILAHPAFAEARNAVISNLIQLFRGDYLLGRLLLEEGRYITIQTLLHLAACQQAEERATWLTLGRLQTRLSGSELASRNRIEALVAILERYGFLERRKAEEDMRVTLLTPTARLWGSDAILVEALAQPLTAFRDLQEPGNGLRHVLCRSRIGTAEAGTAGFDPQAPAWSSRDLASAGAGHRTWHRALAPHLDAFFALRAAHPEIQSLAARDGGYLTFLLLLAEANQAPDNRICLPFETLSNHTGVSRTHARLLMEQAEACGFVRLKAKGGREIEPLPALQQSADIWFADHMAFVLGLG